MNHQFWRQLEFSCWGGWLFQTEWCSWLVRPPAKVFVHCSCANLFCWGTVVTAKLGASFLATGGQELARYSDLAAKRMDFRRSEDCAKLFTQFLGRPVLWVNTHSKDFQHLELWGSEVYRFPSSGNTTRSCLEQLDWGNERHTMPYALQLCRYYMLCYRVFLGLYSLKHWKSKATSGFHITQGNVSVEVPLICRACPEKEAWKHFSGLNWCWCMAPTAQDWRWPHSCDVLRKTWPMAMIIPCSGHSRSWKLVSAHIADGASRHTTRIAFQWGGGSCLTGCDPTVEFRSRRLSCSSHWAVCFCSQPYKAMYIAVLHCITNTNGSCCLRAPGVNWGSSIISEKTRCASLEMAVWNLKATPAFALLIYVIHSENIGSLMIFAASILILEAVIHFRCFPHFDSASLDLI